MPRASALSSNKVELEFFLTETSKFLSVVNKRQLTQLAIVTVCCCRGLPSVGNSGCDLDHSDIICADLHRALYNQEIQLQ